MGESKKTKIAFLIPSLQPGGMERVMSELIGFFTYKPNLEIHLVLFGLSREVFYQIPTSVIIHKPDFEFDNKKRFWHTIKTILFIRKTVKKINPTSILSYGELWNNLVLLALLRTSYPIFISDRCQPNKSIGKLHDFLRKQLYKKADGIIAQTAKAKEIYEAGLVTNKNITVIGNPIQKQIATSILREKIVLSVGRLIGSKHHDELIKIFVKLNQPNWKLIIVGGDALKQKNIAKLNQLISSLKADNNVVLAGNQKDVASYYKRSSIFAFTSSSEGFPNVIGEALSFGLPVVAFDCVAGPADMIEEGKNGNLINLFDYDDFAVKLKRLMNDDDLREKMSAYAPTSVEKFDKNVIGEEYYKFITAV